MADNRFRDSWKAIATMLTHEVNCAAYLSISFWKGQFHALTSRTAISAWIAARDPTLPCETNE